MSLQKSYLNFLAGDDGVAPNASAVVIAANSQRGYLIIINNDDEAISLGLGGNAAVLGKGVVIQPSGSWEMINGTNLDADAVEMISASGGKAVSWQEADVVAS